MTISELEWTTQQLMTRGKGILAADETVATLTRRLDAVGITSDENSRRSYRELLFTTQGVGQFISGVIMQDETIHQRSSGGIAFADVLTQEGIIPGIKVDAGAHPLAGSFGERVTEGLDGLRARLESYQSLGARFAKWRAVISVSEMLPTATCISVNAHALARYAALCQEQGIVPIVEPEVLMDGTHTIQRCEQVTGIVLRAVFDALDGQDVLLEGMLLKPNMVIAGKDCRHTASMQEVALATLRCLRRHVPVAVGGIAFLSGGQDPLGATNHLNAINQLDGRKPWPLTFSYGRALRDDALKAWRGRKDNVTAAQWALFHRAKCNSAAALGRYDVSMEGERAA